MILFPRRILKHTQVNPSIVIKSLKLPSFDIIQKSFQIYLMFLKYGLEMNLI